MYINGTSANQKHMCKSMAQVQTKSICANHRHKCKSWAQVQIMGTSASHGHKCKSMAQVHTQTGKSACTSTHAHYTHTFTDPCAVRRHGYTQNCIHTHKHARVRCIFTCVHINKHTHAHTQTHTHEHTHKHTHLACHP